MTMKRTHLTITLAVTVASLAVLPVSALSNTSADQARLQRIINRGNNEISRRLTTLQGLTNKISSSTKLTADDQASLTDEVNTEISDLTSLKTKLDADTT
jgi:hypothetical protein